MPLLLGREQTSADDACGVALFGWGTVRLELQLTSTRRMIQQWKLQLLKLASIPFAR
jgi:hypothetical protein